MLGMLGLMLPLHLLGMLGTAIASDGDIPDIEGLTKLWKGVVEKLRDAKAVTFPGDLP